MNNHALHIALTQWIRGIFEQGLVLGDDVLRFMESAFGTRDVDAVLSQAHDGEIDSLLELICYPDHALQVRFESRWGHIAFSAHDMAAVVELLVAAPLRTDLVSPAGALVASIDIPPFALEAFVQRLKITWQPPPRLVRALERTHPEKLGLAVRVRLRNSGLAWHADQIRLMELFLQKMPFESEQYEDCLALLICILSELVPGCDGYDFLIAKKFFYFQALCHAEDFERKRRSSNMEIMILKGARAAHGSIEQWRRWMRRIDLICQNLYGRTQFFQQPGEHCLDIENVDPARQVQDVVRHLS